MKYGTVIDFYTSKRTRRKEKSAAEEQSEKKKVLQNETLGRESEEGGKSKRGFYRSCSSKKLAKRLIDHEKEVFAKT